MESDVSHVTQLASAFDCFSCRFDAFEDSVLNLEHVVPFLVENISLCWYPLSVSGNAASWLGWFCPAPTATPSSTRVFLNSYPSRHETT